MADTKVSGLAGAAAFAPSTTQEFPINDAGTSHKVSAAQIAAYFPNGTQGSAWYAQITAASAASAGTTDVAGLSITVTAGTGRRLKVTFFCFGVTQVGAGESDVGIREGATTLALAAANFTASQGTGVQVIAILTPTPGAHTYKVSTITTATTASIYAAATAPAFILAEDIGT